MELYFKLDLIFILEKTSLSNDRYFDLSNFSKLGFINQYGKRIFINILVYSFGKFS